MADYLANVLSELLPPISLHCIDTVVGLCALSTDRVYRELRLALNVDVVHFIVLDFILYNIEFCVNIINFTFS